MRHRLARLLRRAANRLEPVPPLTYEARVPMTEASAKAIADMVDGELGSRVRISYTDPAGFTKTVGPRY